MNNETIALIVGFGIGAFTVAVFATILIVLLLKQRPANDSKPTIVYGQKAKELLDKYCLGDVINTKRMLEEHTKLKSEDCKIIRPGRFLSSFEKRTRLFATLGEDTAKYLFEIETLYKASPKTTESIIEYIDTVKRVVRSTEFTALTTPEKQYVAVRIEEQLCMIIFKYIDGIGGNDSVINKDDEAIIFNAIGLDHLVLLSDL